MDNSGSKDVVKMLWSGGWDSTFRLLQNLLIEKKVVKPYYLIDPERKSFANELYAMGEIKNILFEEFPEARDRLLPTYICEINDVKENPAINKHFQIIKEKYSFGDQYEWLARFADEHELYNIELSREKRDHMPPERKAILPLVYPSKYANARVDPSLWEIFKFYTFPISDISKKDMISIAKQNDFYDLLQLSWSCHCPSMRGKPCGICLPCIDLMESGMSQRLPYMSKVRYYIFKPLIDSKKKHPHLYKFLKKIKRIFSQETTTGFKRS